MSYTTVVTAPVHEPVTLDELKDQVNIPLATLDHDAKLWLFLRTARATAEDFLQRWFVDQTRDYVIDTFPAGNTIRLPGGGLTSITSLTYTDSDDAATVWATTNYFAYTASEPGELVLEDSKSWPSVTLKPKGGIVIRYVLGVATGDLVEEPIRNAILMYAANLWIYREATAIPEEKAQASFDMWRPYILYSFGSQLGVRL